MATGRDAARHAGSLYRRSFAWLRHPVRKAEAEAEHLREIERAGEAGETPFIVILGLVLFLAPLFLFLVGVSFAAYYIAR
jgi:Xaa-Pro aminopeptidase